MKYHFVLSHTKPSDWYEKYTIHWLRTTKEVRQWWALQMAKRDLAKEK